MLKDFMRALARVQTDYGFYIGCQTNPALTLADYSLTSDERLTLSDPKKLAAALEHGVGIRSMKLPSITITISGTHDWVNAAVPISASEDDDTVIATELQAIRHATSDHERTEAVVRLMERIG